MIEDKSQKYNAIYLQTACALLCNGNEHESVEIRMVLDSGNQMTFMKESISTLLNLYVVGVHEIAIVVFGNSQESAKRLFVSSFFMKFKLTDEIPSTRNLLEGMRVLVGPDNYWKVSKGKRKQLFVLSIPLDITWCERKWFNSEFEYRNNFTSKNNQQSFFCLFFLLFTNIKILK